MNTDQKDIELNLLPGCCIEKCEQYKRIYDILSYYKKWVIFKNISRYQMITDMNKILIQENVIKLEEIKGYKKEDNITSIWTDDYNFEKIDAAIIVGKTLYE